MRPTWVVGCIWLLANEAVPIIAIAIESAVPMPFQGDPIPSQDEGCRLVLIAYWHRVVEPVGDVCSPLVSKISSGQSETADQRTERVPWRSILTFFNQVIFITELT